MWNQPTWKSRLPWKWSILEGCICGKWGWSVHHLNRAFLGKLALFKKPLTGKDCRHRKKFVLRAFSMSRHFWKSSRSRPWIRGLYKTKQNGVSILGWKEVTSYWILALLQWRTLFLLVYFTTCSLWSGDLHCTRRRNCSSIMFFWSLLESILMIPSSWTCRRIFRNAQIWKRPLKNVMQLQLT